MLLDKMIKAKKELDRDKKRHITKIIVTPEMYDILLNETEVELLKGNKHVPLGVPFGCKITIEEFLPRDQIVLWYDDGTFNIVVITWTDKKS